MSNAVNVASAASDIVAPLLEADAELKSKKESSTKRRSGPTPAPPWPSPR
jgi:hypothetical protein